MATVRMGMCAALLVFTLSLMCGSGAAAPEPRNAEDGAADATAADGTKVASAGKVVVEKEHLVVTFRQSGLSPELTQGKVLGAGDAKAPGRLDVSYRFVIDPLTLRLAQPEVSLSTTPSATSYCQPSEILARPQRSHMVQFELILVAEPGKIPELPDCRIVLRSRVIRYIDDDDVYRAIESELPEELKGHGWGEDDDDDWEPIRLLLRESARVERLESILERVDVRLTETYSSVRGSQSEVVARIPLEGVEFIPKELLSGGGAVRKPREITLCSGVVDSPDKALKAGHRIECRLTNPEGIELTAAVAFIAPGTTPGKVRLEFGSPGPSPVIVYAQPASSVSLRLFQFDPLLTGELKLTDVTKASTHDVALRSIKPATISGRLDSKGVPLVGAGITSVEWGFCVGADFDLDDNGRFVFEGLPAGRYRLYCHVPYLNEGDDPAHLKKYVLRQVEVKEGQSLELGMLKWSIRDEAEDENPERKGE